MDFDVTIIQEYWWLIVSGLGIVLKISLLSALFGTIIGFISALLRRMNIVFKFIVGAYVDIIRGTPVYVQLYFIFFGLPAIFQGFTFNQQVAAVLIFSINSGAYLSEIMRAGMDNIDKGQIEAAKALGVKSKDITKDIILPQMFRSVLPAIMNEFITLVKETSVVSVIGLHDMMYWFQVVKSQTYKSFEPLLVVFIAYYVVNKILSFIGKGVERMLKYD